MSYIHQRKEKIIEGELRCSQLSEYLDKIGSPRKVWLSEDASGIIAQVTYDPKTNQLVGLTLPNDKNGMPILFSFVPNTLSEINNQMKTNPRSTLSLNRLMIKHVRSFSRSLDLTTSSEQPMY